MNWLTDLWRRLFKREAKPVDPIPYLGSLAPIYKAVALAEPLPPPKSWHSAFEDVDPPSGVVDELVPYANFAEQAMREMERTDRRAQLVAAGLLADAAEADRDQRLEGKMDGWMRRGCPCTDCYARRKASN
jgi:hypothetical protein